MNLQLHSSSPETVQLEIIGKLPGQLAGRNKKILTLSRR
jgi:hypothetical protein